MYALYCRKKIKLQLVVTFKDETGIDGGGLKEDLITMLLDHFNEELDSGTLNDEGKFAAGTWSGNNQYIIVQ